jgi:hypothetical protein
MPTTIKPSRKKLSVWDRLLFSELPSPTAARALLKLQFSEDHVHRMEELSAKARDGILSDDENKELTAYEQLGTALTILHSQARRALKGRSS